MQRPTRLGHVEVTSIFPGTPIERAPVTTTTPVIIRGSSALGKVADWTPEYISERFADREVPISVADPDGTFRYDPDSEAGLRFEKMRGATLAAEFRRVPVTRKLCLQQLPIDARVPELAGEMSVPPFIPAAKLNEINLWMASPDSRTPLHYDDMHNLFAQIEGRKRFVLFNPDQFEDLYPGPLNTRSESFSRVDLKRPDFKRFPRLADVEYWEAVVWPGDLLFMPAYWWHHVSSQDVSVSVNYWWRPDVRDALCPAFLRQLYLNLNLEDVNALFEAFDFSALGTGSAALLALAEMALDHSEPGAATRICGGITVASLRESLSLAEADVPSLVAALGPEHDPARRCITAALRARPGRPSPEAADLIAQLRASNLTFQTG